MKAQKTSDVLEVGLYDMMDLTTRDGLLRFMTSLYHVMYGRVVPGGESS